MLEREPKKEKRQKVSDIKSANGRPLTGLSYIQGTVRKLVKHKKQTKIVKSTDAGKQYDRFKI